MKNVLVTGAYGGMGKATVKALVKNGCKVFALDRVVGEAEENVVPIEADVTDGKSVASALDRVRAVTDTLDAIVHFAGIYMLDSLVEMDESSFDRILDVNLKGAFLINKIFVSMLKKGSRIVITTSELAPLDPLPFTGIYAVSKSALDKYAYSLCMELQLLDISVSVLRAGAVDTGMLGVSSCELDTFCDGTKLYCCNAERFKRIVDGVESRKVAPETLGEKVVRILSSPNPAFSYSLNRNPLLLILNALPKRLQLGMIRRILR